MALTNLDRTLLKRCLDREPGAWKDFVDRFLGLFFHVIHNSAQARSVQLSNADRDDLCGEIFLALLANDYAVLRQFRGKSSLATYLVVIARRVVVREMARRRMAEALGHVAAHGAALEQAPDRRPAAPQEDAEQVYAMIKSLPTTEAEMVRQFYIEGRSYREISTGLGVPENSVGPTLTRARERMRRGAGG